MTTHLTRLLTLLAALPVLSAALPDPAAAQQPLRIEITEGVIEPLPFAVPTFVPEGGAAADDLDPFVDVRRRTHLDRQAEPVQQLRPQLAFLGVPGADKHEARVGAQSHAHE